MQMSPMISLYDDAPVPAVHEKSTVEPLNWVPGEGVVSTPCEGVPNSV